MKLLFLIFVFVMFANISKAEINVNKCDNLTKRTDKLSCLTKLKAKAIKENSKEKTKINPINLTSYLLLNTRVGTVRSSGSLFF